MTRKGFIIGADLKLEFNRIPWRTGPDGKYEVDGPDCLTGGPGAGAAPPGPGMAGGGCPPAPLPGDCGLPPAQPHPRSRFNPLPMHDVLNGGAPVPPPCMSLPNGQIIQQEVLPEVVPQPPAKPLEKVPPAPPGNPTKTDAPFQLEEKEESPSAKSTPSSRWISNRSRSATAP